MTVEELQSLILLISSGTLFVGLVVLNWHTKFHKKPKQDPYQEDEHGDNIEF
jgi:hypothetical protein